MKFRLILAAFFLFLSSVAWAEAPQVGILKAQTMTIKYTFGTLELRYGVQKPQGTVIGDVLYLHGLGDRLDNHARLFEEWNKAGFRVISFDLPSHGENKGTSNDLNKYTFGDLISLASQVERATLEDEKRPLILAGWSTGGLIAVRAVQSEHLSKLKRTPTALILFAPGVSVHPIVGEQSFKYPLGEITGATLSHDPNLAQFHKGPIQPKSPGEKKEFAADLLLNSTMSWAEGYPRNIPTLVLVGGIDEDKYVKSDKVYEWAINQSKNNGVDIKVVSCPEARHELDNEAASYGGEEARSIAATFAGGIVSGKSSSNSILAGNICLHVF